MGVLYPHFLCIFVKNYVMGFKRINKKYDAQLFGLLINHRAPGLDLSDIKYNLKKSFKSFKKFFHAIWWFRGSDRDYTLELMKISFKEHLVSLENGNEIEETREPKITSIKRAIEIINNIQEDNFAERCGYDYNFDVSFEPIEGSKFYEMVDNKTKEQNEINDKAITDGQKLMKDEWSEFCDIIKDLDKGFLTWWT